jgi:hypothetical protein
MIEGSGSRDDPDPYLVLTEPGGPKTYGCGSGSATLLLRRPYLRVMLQVAAPVHVHDEREPGRPVGGGAELQLEPRGNKV